MIQKNPELRGGFWQSIFKSQVGEWEIGYMGEQGGVTRIHMISAEEASALCSRSSSS